MKRLVSMFVLLAACGGGTRGRTTMPRAAPSVIGLQPSVVMQAWYRSPVPCGQGPYEIAIPIAASKWEQEIELRLHAPRGVALHAVMLANDVEVARTSGTYDLNGENAHVDNARCIADKRERVQLGVGGAVATAESGAPGGAMERSSVPASPQRSTVAQLELDTRIVASSMGVLRFRVRDGIDRVVVRFWSIEPNDLTGVLFGVAHVAWQPNVPEHVYEAHLAALEAERVRRAELDAAEQARRDAAARHAYEAEREKRARELRIAVEVQRELAHCRQLQVGQRSVRCRKLVDEDDARRRAAEAERVAYERRMREAEDAARRRAREAEEAERRRAREAEAAARAVQLTIALEADRKRRRAEHCASHPDDRDCWGAGGMKVHRELERRKLEREQYCASHREDARCWSEADRQRVRAAAQQRIELALQPPPVPDGPPPAPLAEEIPPKLSVNAEWRAGYWHWLDGRWVWLAGMWRVPEADIVAELTTTAPAAPPPPRAEVPPSPPVHHAVWVGGFWQWNGSGWVWIAGSYQLRPEARVTWRAAEWKPRGRVHVLIPGGWIQIGGSR